MKVFSWNDSNEEALDIGITQRRPTAVTGASIAPDILGTTLANSSYCVSVATLQENGVATIQNSASLDGLSVADRRGRDHIPPSADGALTLPQESYPGTPGTDVLIGTSADDTFSVNASDTAIGGYGNDVFTTAWPSSDTGTVTLEGDAGHDVFNVTFTGANQGVAASGGAGLDTFVVNGVGAVTLDGGSDNDTFILNGVGKATLTLGSGRDFVQLTGKNPNSLITITDFEAGANGDILDLGNYLDAAAAWDNETNPFASGLLRLTASGTDTIVQAYLSGNWNDVVILKNVAPGALVASNFSGLAPDGSATLQTVVETDQHGIGNEYSPRTYYGSSAPDIIFAGGESDTIYGGAGDDEIYGTLGYYYNNPLATNRNVLDGGPGDDYLVGGATMTGGPGSDTFVCYSGTDTTIITDFTPGTDKLIFYGYDQAGSISDGMGYPYSAYQDVAGTWIKFAYGGTAFLCGVTSASLSATDITYLPYNGGRSPEPVIATSGTANTSGLQLSADYTLAAGENLWLDGLNGQINIPNTLSSTVTVTIAGTLTRTGTTWNGTAINAAGDLNATVTSTGVINVLVRPSNPPTADDQYRQAKAYGVFSDRHGDFSNQGAITVVDEWAPAYGVFYDDGRIANSGSIRVWSNADATGVELYNGGTFVNSATGTITVEGQTAAIAVGLYHENDFTNAGTITAHCGDPLQSSIAVEIEYATSFVNSGTITGDYALYVDAGIFPSKAWTNSGKMFGIVWLDDSADTLRNSGLINGAVYLQGGDDVYDGTGGTQYGGVYGGTGDDTLIGGAGADYLFGGEGNDTIQGGAGDDVIDGGRGTNTLDGGAGNDTLSFASSNAPVVVDLTSTIVSAPGLLDTISGFENATGSNFDDHLIGTAGDNQLDGGAGNDVISGGDGNDWITGGTGDDLLTGGAGNDIFKFSAGDGHDTITDFNAVGDDTLFLFGYSAYQSLTQVGADALVTLSAQDSILLKNVDAASLTSADFHFSTTVPSPPRVQAPPPAGSETILYVGDYTVNAGETMTFVGLSYAFDGEGLDDNFTNMGTVNVTAAGYTVGLKTWAAQKTIVNAAGAIWNVENTGTVNTAYGYYSVSNGQNAINNNGTWTVGSANDAVGFFSGGSGDVLTNTASFAVTAEGSAIGAWFHNSAAVVNSGTISVHGGTVATAILSSNSYGSTVTNTGTVNARIDDPTARSIAFQLVQCVVGQDHLINSGTITADVVLDVVPQQYYTTSTVLVDNSGTMNGDIHIPLVAATNVVSGKIATTVKNSGTITGNIEFGSGNDVYDGHSGTLVGRVDGGDGTDTLTGIERLQFSDGTLSLPSAVADANGDGNSDIFWQNSDGTPAIWTMNGLTQLDGSPVGGNPGSSWHLVGTGDFNGDGKTDILWQNDNGQADIWTVDGFTLLSGAMVGGNPGPSWHIEGTGDFNGDGTADILWQNDSGQAAIWTMNGFTQLGGSPIGGNPGADWHIKGTGDFNGDGKSDILWQNDNGQAAIWLMDGFNVLAGGPVGGNPGTSWKVIGAGDFDGDGKADILWQNDSGQAAIWTMDGLNQTGGSPVGGNPGPTWHVIGAGDYNGDGYADILWQNDNGQAAIWTMQGFTQLGGAMVGGNPGTTWHIPVGVG